MLETKKRKRHRNFLFYRCLHAASLKKKNEKGFVHLDCSCVFSCQLGDAAILFLMPPIWGTLAPATMCILVTAIFRELRFIQRLLQCQRESFILRQVALKHRCADATFIYCARSLRGRRWPLGCCASPPIHHLGCR